MSEKGKRRSLKRRVAFWSLVAFVLLVVTGVTVLRLRFNGKHLARLVESELNDRIRGRVEIGSIKWPLRDITKTVTGGWVSIKIYDLVVYDERQEIVLKTDYATAKLDAHAAMFGRNDMILKDIKIPNGGYVLLEEIAEPFPVHEYDTHVVSIVSAFYSNKLDHSFAAGISATSAVKFDLRDFAVNNVTVDFVFPDIETSGHVEGVSGSGFLFSDRSKPLALKLYFALSAKARTGYLEAMEYRTNLHDIKIKSLKQLPNRWPRSSAAEDIEWDATAKATHPSWALMEKPPRPAEVTVRGAMREWWSDYYGGDYDVKVEIHKAGPLVSSLSPNEMAGGKDLSIQLDVTGPVLRPKYNIGLYKLQLNLPLSEDQPRMQLDMERFVAAWDMATEQGYLEDTLAKGAGGEVQLSATFGLNPLLFDVYVGIPKPINLHPYVKFPPELRQHIGTRLSGRMHAFGNQDLQRIDKIDLRLGRANLLGRLYRQVGEGEVIHTEKLDVIVGKTVVSSRRGWLDYATKTFDQKLTFYSKDLAQWLRRFKAPVLGREVRQGNAWVGGTFTNPRATASFQLHGVPVIKRVDTNLTYENKLLNIRRASANALSGTLIAGGRIRLGNYTRVLGFDARARKVDLSKLPGVGKLLTGVASAHVYASGPTHRLRADLIGCVDELQIAGDSYSNFQIVGAQLANGEQTIDLSVDRNPVGKAPSSGACGVMDARQPATLPLPDPANAGHLRLTAKLDKRNNISGTLALHALPIETLAVLGGDEGASPVGGVVSSRLKLGGSVLAPLIDGRIGLRKGWYRTAYLGNGGIRIKPKGKTAVELDGKLFGGMVELGGTVGTVPPYSTDVTVGFRRVEIDRLLPALAAKHDLRGWATGKLRARSALLSNVKPTLDLVLEETELVVRGVDSKGRPAPIRVYNKTPIEIAYDGLTARLLKPVTFRGPAGDFVVKGWAREDKLSIDVDGLIAVSMLTPYFQEYFDAMMGTVKASIELRGRIDKMQIRATVDFDRAHDKKKQPVSLRPLGQDALVSIPTGHIEISNSKLTFGNGTKTMKLVVTDEYSRESSLLELRGDIDMDEFAPTGWNVKLRGDLAGKMLLVMAPKALSAAGGSAVLDLAMTGRKPFPDINGSLKLDRPGSCGDGSSCTRDSECAGAGNVCVRRGRPLSVTPRGLRRDITLTSGEIKFSRRGVSFSRVSLLFDNEGRINLTRGNIKLVGWQPSEIDVTLAASGVPFRIAKELDLSLSASRVRISKRPGRPLQIGGGGRIEIVDGRYTRKFNVIQQTIKPASSTGSSKPFYEDVPLLANAELNLRLRAQAFYVQNNLANIELNGGVRVGGTLANPTFSGTIRVEQGNMKFPFLRARFTITGGTVGFSALKKFPEESPRLRIKSEADFRDTSGQDHLVTLEIKGPLSALDWDLYTSTGLNKGQTVALLTLGRSTEDFRRSLGDEGVARDPTRIETSTQGDTAVYDQFVKDLAGDFISLLLEDKLRNLTGLDVARLEIGTSSIGFHGEKNFLKNLKLLIDFERTLRGLTIDGRLQLKITGKHSVEAQILDKNFDDVTEDDFSDRRIRWVIRIPVL